MLRPTLLLIGLRSGRRGRLRLRGRRLRLLLGAGLLLRRLGGLLRFSLLFSRQRGG